VTLGDARIIDLLGGIAILAIFFVVVSRWGRRHRGTRSTAVHRARSFLLSALFNSILLVGLPWFAHRLIPGLLPIPLALGRLVGAVLVVLGAGALISSVDAFGRRGHGTPSPLDPPSLLVTDGLFGVVRNPIILAELMVIWGEALFLSSLGIAAYAIVVSLLSHLGVVRNEEPELRKRFGESYEAYFRQVPRWVPRLRPRRSASH